MRRKQLLCHGLALIALMFFALPAGAQNFMVQCPKATLLHPTPPGATEPGGANTQYDAYNATGATVAYTPADGVVIPNNYGPHYENFYTGPFNSNVTAAGVPLTYVSNGGTVKCQQISGGDGHMTEADGNQTFMFAFGPLSGLDKIANSVAGTDFPDEFDQSYCNPPTTPSGTSGNYNNGQLDPYANGSPNPLNSSQPSITCSQNGAVGYVNPPNAVTAIGVAFLVGNGSPVTNSSGQSISTGLLAVQIAPNADNPGVTPGSGYTAPPTVTFGPPQCTTNGVVVGGILCTLPPGATSFTTATGTATIGLGSVIEVAITSPGSGYVAAPAVSFSAPLASNNLIPNTDPAAVMNTGVMNGSIPGPLIGFDEDDEFLLTLTNVGMIMRPDLFEQHTVHFHGYPNASSFYDGVPDATIAINIGASFTYYYMAPDAGTYFWHCHITPPEHLQMGMDGWLYVRARQNRVPPGTDLYYGMTGTGKIGATTNGAFGTATGLSQQSDPRTACNSGNFATTYGTNNIATNGGAGESNLYAGTAAGAAGTNPGGAGTAPDITCSVPSPAADTGALHIAGRKYVYNDGDGSTQYDIDFPIQMHGFDPNFHFVGMTFNPEGFADMKDKYFLLNGRSYPDDVDVATGSTINEGGYAPTGVTAIPCAGSAGVQPCSFNLALTNWTGGVPAGTTNPDTTTNNAQWTMGTDGNQRPTQPARALLVLSQTGSVDGLGNPTPQRAALRINNLSVTEYHTLASLSIPIHVVGWMAKMLRDQAGNNLGYWTNSITIGGGESMDAILDACEVRTGPPNYVCTTPVPQGTYFIYTPNLDHLSNDAENFGGMMTEVVIAP